LCIFYTKLRHGVVIDGSLGLKLKYLHTPPRFSGPPLSRVEFVMFIILMYSYLLVSILKSSTSLNSSLLASII